MSIQTFDVPMQILILVFFGMLGGIMASFFTCMGGRIAEGKD